jgi:hypothetical protein
MRLRSLARCIPLLVTAWLLPPSAASGRTPVHPWERVLPIGASVDWDEHNPHPVRIRAGKLHVTVFSGRHQGITVPMVRVSVGSRSVLVRGWDQYNSFARARISIGRWDRAGHPFVLVAQDEGGAHCCLWLRVFVAEGAGLSVTDFGERDDNTFKPVPRDLDGDGRPDFVLKDDRFLYRFSSYAGSWPPPLILNVVHGRIVDVSARRAFVTMFRRAMVKARPWCVARGENLDGPGACLGYLASAARAGHYPEAWRDLLQTYDWKAAVSVSLCKRKPDPVRQCPAERSVTFSSLPEALRGFIKSLGYID